MAPSAETVKLFNLPADKRRQALVEKAEAMGKEKKRVMDETITSLRQRIANGAKWLIENQDDPKWDKMLGVYEGLVDEARELGDVDPEADIDKIVKFFNQPV